MVILAVAVAVEVVLVLVVVVGVGVGEGWSGVLLWGRCDVVVLMVVSAIVMMVVA